MSRQIIHPDFKKYTLFNAEIETLGTGFRWLEGPVWLGDANCLLFQDLPRNRTMRWSEDGITIHRAPSHFANGQTRDRQGRLIACSHQSRCIFRTEYDGSITTLISHFNGKRLNAPNDVVVKSDGSIWFTDPLYGLQIDYEGGRQMSEQPPAVYRYDPATNEATIVAADFDGPNGIAFSPDESLIYIVETGDSAKPPQKQHIRVFNVHGKTLSGGAIFHKIDPGNADGIKCDEHGNVWSSAGDGVHCISPSGALLGKILLPHRVANLAFGELHKNRLFICASHTLYALYVNVRGAAWP